MRGIKLKGKKKFNDGGINPWQIDPFVHPTMPGQVNPPLINQALLRPDPQSLMDPSMQDNSLGWATKIKKNGNNKDGSPNWKTDKQNQGLQNPQDLMYMLNAGIRGISETYNRNQENNYFQSNLANPLANLPFNNQRSDGVKYGYEQFKGGGQKKPIYTTDKKDPKLKAYSDSLNLYNKSNLEVAKFLTEVRKRNLDENEIYTSPNNYKGKDKISPIAYKDLSKRGSEGGINIPNTNYYRVNNSIDDLKILESQDPFKISVPIYKKPVQPIVYQKERTPVYGNPVLNQRQDFSTGMANPVQAPNMEIPAYQMRGNQPLYGPNKSMIGMLGEDGFYPDYMNTASRTEVNIGDNDLINNEEGLQQYLKSKGANVPIKKFVKGGKVKHPDGGLQIGPVEANQIQGAYAVSKGGTTDFDTIPSYLYYIKAAKENNVEGMKNAYSHIAQIRGADTANDIKRLGDNLKISSLNNIAKRGVSIEKNPQMKNLYSMVNDNPDLLDHFQYALPQNPNTNSVAKFAMGGSNFNQAIVDYLYGNDEDDKAVTQNTAPSVEEVEEVQPQASAPRDTTEDDMISAMLSAQDAPTDFGRGAYTNPYKEARLNFTSSGKYGTQNIGTKGREIATELTQDLGYSPKFNSIYRDPAQQAKLVAQGVGAKNSYHLTGDAVDLKPSDWEKLSTSQKSKYKSKYDVISHNGHIHLEPKGKR